MTPDRFWDLIDTLEGVADDERCARLDTRLRESGEAADFADALDERVEALVRGCRWPAEVAGSDVMNWVAAAVVAAGREAYDAAQAERLVDPDRWPWDEAEALLVVGAEEGEKGPLEPHGDPVAPVGIALQWLAVPSPEGVGTPHDVDPDDPIDTGDDPVWGRVPVRDPDWLLARDQLAADPHFVARRAALADMRLWLTVRPATEPGQPDPDPLEHSPFDGVRPVSTPTVYRFSDEERETVVLAVPDSDFPATGSRVDAYVAAAQRLLDAASGSERS